jgi:hypothetical protein
MRYLLKPMSVLALLILLSAIAATFLLYLSGRRDEAEFLLRIVTALGVLCAVSVALYGDRIKRTVNRVELRIEKPDQSDNFPNVDQDGPHYAHHLRVKNGVPSEPVINCRVWLIKILDTNDAGAFEERFKFGVPRLMNWAPAEYSPDVRSFSEDQVFDFGWLSINQNRFELSYHQYQGGFFKGSCQRGQRRRYVFRITADNYIRADPITVEVAVENCEPSATWQHDLNVRVEIIA